MHHINQIEDKNNISRAKTVEKALEKIQHNFIIKILNKLAIEGNFFHLVTSMKNP